MLLAVGGDANFRFNHNIEMGISYEIEIVQEKENGKLLYKVNINGEEIQNVENTNPQSFKDVKVFVGDNFYPATDASYNNLMWENLESSPWVKVFSHDVAGGLFKSDAEALNKNPDDPDALLFSRLDQLENFKTEDGFHLKIVYPELDGSNEWIQTSNPATDSEIEGFQPIKLDFQNDGLNNPWGGLGNYKFLSSGIALISDTPLNAHFMCIGCQVWWPSTGTIPGPRDKTVTRVELYVVNGKYQNVSLF